MFKAEGLITPVVTALTETEEFNKKNTRLLSTT